MKKLMIIVSIFFLFSLKAYAKQSCGVYWMAGNPTCSPVSSCEKSGIYLFKGTANQVFIEIEGYSLPQGLAQLEADYSFQVKVNQEFEVLPKKVIFVTGPDSMKSLKQLRKGFGLVKKKKCKS